MTKPNRIDVAHMIEGIGRWVRQESPTRDTTAVNRMIDIVQSEVVDLPVTTERIPGRDGLADMLVVRSAGNGPGILILSHIDTVHPIGMIDEALCFRRDGDRLYGPGLYDMKGGAYLALEAFRQVVRAGSARLPLTFLFTPDEEIGSPMSRSLIEREAPSPLRAGHGACLRGRQSHHPAQGRWALRRESHRRSVPRGNAPSGRP
jgi:glutamate carboxypeptidase